MSTFDVVIDTPYGKDEIWVLKCDQCGKEVTSYSADGWLTVVPTKHKDDYDDLDFCSATCASDYLSSGVVNRG